MTRSRTPQQIKRANEATVRFDRQTWRRFVMLVRLFFTSEQRWKALGLLILLVTFAISLSGINVLLSFVGRDFMTALSIRDRDGFYKQLFYYLGAFAIATPVVVLYRYTEERLNLFWRRWLSLKMLRSYLHRRVYYKMNWEGGIDNPDQRIEEDIRTFTQMTLLIFLVILNSCFGLYAFLRILWEISHLLTFVVIGYAVFGSFCTYFLGRPLIGLYFNQLKLDANYRYKLINLRDNAESVALYEGEAKEFTRTRQRLKAVLYNVLQVVNWNRNLNFFVQGYNYLVTIIPTVIVAPLYLNGTIEFGMITQSAFAFGQVLGSLSIIISNFGGISTLAAVSSRLGAFYEKTQEIAAGAEETQVSKQRILRERSLAVRFDGVTICTPLQGKVLIRDLTFSLDSGGMLITGPSGSGKSSIIRCLSGLWNEGSGTIYAPNRDEMFFVPQRPYMILGSLRAQILYGTRRKGVTESEIKEIIEHVHLQEMLERVGGLDTIQDWPNFLATGEQQKIAFARLLLAKPRVALLDEATSALDPVSEEYLYGLVRSNVKEFISVGHRALLGKYHGLHLELKGNGLWILEKTTP